MDAVRPGQCDKCKSPAYCDGRVVIQGHGVVTRQRLGPVRRGGKPGVGLQTVRKYRCDACGHVMRVTHAALLRYRHYGAGVIAEALGRWGVELEPAKRVRAALSPLRPGAASTGWRSLGRWAAGAAAGRLWQGVTSALEARVRTLGERVGRLLAGLAQAVEGGLTAQLWAAAELAR